MSIGDDLPLFARAGGEPNLTVTELTALVRATLETAFEAEVAVAGEISNFKHHAARHMYFSLKDEGAVLRCIFFAPDNTRIRFAPGDGLAVVARGRLGVYPPQGTYQLYVSSLALRGEGELMAAFERLKNRLAAEGLFDADRKVPLPRFPRVVGVVTSPSGAAFRDIRTVLGRRWPGIEIVLRPTLVQGSAAAADVAAAVAEFDAWGGADVLIVGRGGGSLEDLWAFNEEPAVRAIAAARTPVISAVGHETDFTLADLAADVRAATPSAAAELAAPVKAEVERDLADLTASARAAAVTYLADRRDDVARALASYGFRAVPGRLAERRQRVDQLGGRAARAARHALAQTQSRFASATRAFAALSPRATLARGYNLATRDGLVVKRAADAHPGDALNLHFSDGVRDARVTDDREE
jgi:exodeoxyribonuclease VII large subunit